MAGVGHVAVDLGAESGRVIVGDLTAIEVAHRFANGPVRVGDRIYWDILAIFSEIKNGLRRALQGSAELASVGIDTWGVDYGLLDEAGELLGMPYHYRDSRTEGVPDRVTELIDRRDLYRHTGIQTMLFNTLYQLFAHKQHRPEMLRAAQRFLTIPDLLHYWLCGVQANEYTISSTTQLLDPRTRDWSPEVLRAVGLTPQLFGPVVMPGTELGSLAPGLHAELGGGGGIRVVAPGSHDTASAVAAVPSNGNDEQWAYISSGTWSLLGIEAAEPIINDASFRYDFTNEGGVGGIRYLKNIMGLWIVQECKRAWNSAGSDYSYAQLTAMAEASAAAPFQIDPNDQRFFAPSLIGDSMPDRLDAYCRETNQRPPADPGTSIRGVLESLASAYSRTLAQVTASTGRTFRRLHIIGGGCQNGLLCQLAANACCIPVHAGPVEATALGNILVQQLAAGSVASVADGRRMIAMHHPVQTYQPQTSSRPGNTN